MGLCFTRSIALLATNLFMNAFFLYSGLRMTISGIRTRRVGDINGGAMIIALLIALHVGRRSFRAGKD